MALKLGRVRDLVSVLKKFLTKPIPDDPVAALITDMAAFESQFDGSKKSKVQEK